MQFGDYYTAIGIAFGVLTFIAGCIYTGIQAADHDSYYGGIDLFMHIFIGCFCLPFLVGLVWIVLIPVFIIAGGVYLYKREHN